MSAKARFRGALVAALLALVAGPSFGFQMILNTAVGTVSAGIPVPCDYPGGFAHWNLSDIHWYRNNSLQGWAKLPELQRAMDSWTNVPGANHTLIYTDLTTAAWATDGINTLSWGTGNGCSGSCLALTALTFQPGQVIVEADVTFNNDYFWESDLGGIDVEAVAAHELGHTLGIHHTDLATNPLPTMNAFYNGLDGRSLEADDLAALQCAQAVYPVPLAPGAPALLDVQPESCRGLVTLTWSSVSGATFYEVQRSATSTFSSVTSIYSGTATSLFHNGGTGTKWYRVRACNAGGCSAWREGNRSVTYRSGCA